jgi:hypothetical protein
MATGNIISICNRALLSIGSQAQISSLNENSAQANVANTLFTPTFEQLARTAPWNCLRKEATLTLLAAANGTPENPNGTTLPLPPVPWLYQYQYPSDMLQMRWIQPQLPAPTNGVPIFSSNTSSSTWLPNGGQIPYAVAYATDSNNNPLNVILTNQSQAIAVYTVNQPNPQIWDSLFQAAMVASLAAYFVPALSLHLPLMNVQIKLAEAMIQQARVRDGNEGVTSMDHVPDFIRARNGATGMAGRFGYQGYGAYSSMNWPGY